jgi:hypothetical protein
MVNYSLFCNPVKNLFIYSIPAEIQSHSGGFRHSCRNLWESEKYRSHPLLLSTI